MERSKGTREVFTPVLEKVRVMQCVTEPHWADLEKEMHNYGEKEQKNTRDRK